MVQLRKDDKTKNVGVVKLNLVDYIERTSQGRQKVLLDKCPDKQASIQFTMKATLINSASGSETASMMSCDMSIDSGPESEYNFDDFENQDKPKPRLRASSAQRMSLGQIQVASAGGLG